MAQANVLDVECEVGSRIHWGPILAGALVALAAFFTLSLLGAAVGFTARGSLDREELRIGAGVWSMVALALSLFLGGWVVSQCTVGENRTDAVMNGAIVWAATLSLLLFLTGSNLGAGLGSQSVGMSGDSADRGASADGATAAAADPGNTSERTHDEVRNALWGAFIAAFGSLLTAICGALMGPYQLVRRTDRLGRRDVEQRVT